VNVLEVPVVKYRDNDRDYITEQVAVEEPLEIYIDNQPFYMTMRLPGEEVPLALGLCFTDGLITSMSDVAGANFCGEISRNRVNVFLSDERRKRPVRERPKQFTSYSSCGLCGSDMILDLTQSIARIDAKTAVEFSALFPMQDIMVEKQEARRSTGATHAASIFDARGNFLSFSEDVGRHNALDKAIGKILFEGKIDEARIVHLSSRLSYEMVMKAGRLRAEILTGVSAATSLAIQVAEALGITLIGSLRDRRGNIFTHPRRIL
jgi:FdhD protein